MNNKGFNWFFPVVVMALVLLFGTNIFMSSDKAEISEEKFFTLLQQEKVQDVMVYRDNFTADIFLTQNAKNELSKKTEKSN